jgi:hypothetical protein
MRTFNFFRGIVSAKVISIANAINELNNQPRYPRTPIGQIPYPESCETPEEKRIYRKGWRACEQGREIHSNPYSNRENLIYTLHRAWEIGWLECYHNHPSRTTPPTDEQCYLNGWERAQAGYPLNENPWAFGSNQYNMWHIGWADFIDNH